MRKSLGLVVPAFCAGLLVAFTAPVTAPAEAAPVCLAGPNGASPKGQHWYYRIDRASGRKCWYLGQLGQQVRRAAPSGPARVQRAEPMLPRQVETDVRAEEENADVWPKLEPVPLRVAETAPSAPPAAAEPRPAVQANAPVPAEPGPVQVANDSPPVPMAQAAASSFTPLSFVLLLIAMAILGFAGRMLYKLATRRRIHVDRFAEPDRVERSRFGFKIASPKLAPEDEPLRADDMLRRFLTSLERRVA